MDVEELGRAAVEAHALALVELGLAVVVGDTLFGACACEATKRDQKSQISGWFSRRGLARRGK